MPALLSEGQSRPVFRETAVAAADGVILNLGVGPDHGPPLVCIHGLGRCWRDYMTLFPALLPYWKLHGVDLRGHGKSSRVTGRYLIRDYLEDMGSLLEHVGQPVVLFGHSLGAILALAAAARWPEQVKAVVAEDPPSEGFLERILETPYAPMFEAMQRLAGSAESHDVRGAACALGDVIVARDEAGRPIRLAETRDGASLRMSARFARDLDPGIYEPVLARRWCEGLDLPGLLPRIACPVLLLRGDEARGGMLPRADAETMLAQIPDATLVDFPGVGHQIHAMDCANLVRVTVSFLESL